MIKKKWKNVCDSYKKCLDHGRHICKYVSGLVKFHLAGCIMSYISLEMLYETVLHQVTSLYKLPNSQVVNLRDQFL